MDKQADDIAVLNGTRGLLAAHSAELRVQTTEDPGVLANVDYPHDLGQRGK